MVRELQARCRCMNRDKLRQWSAEGGQQNSKRGRVKPDRGVAPYSVKCQIKHYSSSRPLSLNVCPFFGADRGLDSSFASVSLFFAPFEAAGLPSPDLGDLHGSGIGLVGSMGTCFTVPTLK